MLTYSERLHRLLVRWDPRAVLISDERARRAASRLDGPPDAAVSSAELRDASWVCDVSVHPVLREPIPSAFRLGSFMPVTATVGLGMISTHSPLGLLWYHWLYQSHSAGCRYCNYADTSRPLDATRMLHAYAASTVAAVGVAAGAAALARRTPRMKMLGLLAPHSAVACAGAISTVANSTEFENGIAVTDASGETVGVSRVAAQSTVARAVLLHSFLVPSCALLAPVLAMRLYVVPKLLHRLPSLMMPSAAALVLGGVCVLTPVASAAMPATIEIPVASLEPDLRDALQSRKLESVYSSRVLY